MNSVNAWESFPINLTPDDVWKKKIIPIGKQAVYSLCHVPGFPVVKIGKKYIIPRDQLRIWLENEAGK